MGLLLKACCFGLLGSGVGLQRSPKQHTWQGFVSDYATGIAAARSPKQRGADTTITHHEPQLIATVNVL